MPPPPPPRWLGEYMLANNPNKPKVADVDDKLLEEEEEREEEGGGVEAADEGGEGVALPTAGQLQQ